MAKYRRRPKNPVASRRIVSVRKTEGKRRKKPMRPTERDKEEGKSRSALLASTASRGCSKKLGETGDKNICYGSRRTREKAQTRVTTTVHRYARAPNEKRGTVDYFRRRALRHAARPRERTARTSRAAPREIWPIRDKKKYPIRSSTFI